MGKNKPPTEAEVKGALDVLRRDYYADVHALAGAFRDAKAYAAKHGKAFDPHDTLHEIVDGSQRVFYTFQARIGLLCTGNEDAYEEDFGDKPTSPEQAMFAALMRDVQYVLGDECSEIEPTDDGNAEAL